MTEIRAVAFDYGNVLSRPQQRDGLDALAHTRGWNLTDFSRRYFEHRLDYDRGILTGESYWSRVVGTEVGTVEVAELIQTDAASWQTLNAQMVRWVHELRAANIAAAMLSNIPHDVLRVLRQKHPSLLEHFAAAVFSCEAGCVKPERPIYDRLISALKIPASQIVFIDDVKENVDAAVDAGLHAIQFESCDQTRRHFSTHFRGPSMR